MELPDTSEPRPRHDGWTPERKVRFLDCLSRSGNVRVACSKVGLSREAAYRLRRRDPVFERAWAAALAQARDLSIEALAERAVEGVEEPIYYRGELVGTRRRYDSRLLLAHIARLDKLVDEDAVKNDAARFDELLAHLGEEEAPANWYGADDALPLAREAVAERVGVVAEAEREAELDQSGEYDAPEARDDYHDECVAAYRRGRAEGAELWDAWFEDACSYVDFASGWSDNPPLEGLPGNPLPPPLASALAAAAKQPERPLEFFARTMCASSTSSLARALTVKVHRFETAAPRSPVRRASG